MSRRHGCQWPLDPYQVGAITFFAGIVACCYGLQMPVIQDYGTKVALIVIYTVLVALAVALSLACSIIDPSDSGLQGNSGSGDYFCSLCQASVGRTSKHCKACDRCVEGFDHHCKWLNNCVGKRNYKYFIVLVSGTMAACICQFAWALWLVVRSFTEKEEMKPELVISYGGDVNYIGWQFFLVLYLVLLAVALVMVGELFSFHVVLISKGMTTYDYIIAQREKQAFEEGGESGLSETLSTAKGVLKCICCCKPSQVHDESHAASRVSRSKVGLNPCAAMTASKPQGSPFTYGKRKAPPPADADPDANSEIHGTESNGSYPHNVQMWAKATLDNESTSGANTPSRVSEHVGSPVSEQYMHGVSASPGGVQTNLPMPGVMSSPQQQQQQLLLQQDISAIPQHWQPQLQRATPPVSSPQVAGLSEPTYQHQQQQLGALQQAVPLTQQQLQQTQQQLQHLLHQQQQQQQQQPPHLHKQAPSLISAQPSTNSQHPVATYNNPFYQTHPPVSPWHPPAPSSAHGSLPTSPSQQRTKPVPHAQQAPRPPPGHTLPPIHLTSSRNATGKRALSPIPTTALLSGSDALHAAADASNRSDQGEVPAQDVWQGYGSAPNIGAAQGRGAGLGGYPQQGGIAAAQPGAWSLMYPSYTQQAPDNRTSYQYDAEMSSEVT